MKIFKNVQKLILKKKEIFFKSRDSFSFMKNFTMNSNFNEINKFDHVTLRN